MDSNVVEMLGFFMSLSTVLSQTVHTIITNQIHEKAQLFHYAWYFQYDSFISSQSRTGKNNNQSEAKYSNQ